MRRKPIKNMEKRERGRSQETPPIFWVTLLSQERVNKLRTSYLLRVFTGSIRTKAHEKFCEK